jgi:L-asparagine transporter-like permease
MFITFSIIVIVIINLFKIVSYNISVILEFKLWFTIKEYQLTSGRMSSFMTIIEEVGSPVAAALVVMVVIDIDGSVSSSRFDLQYQW